MKKEYTKESRNMKKSYAIALLIVTSLLFYWFQYRPSKIKKECSWVHAHTDAVAAQPSKTVEQLKQEGIYENCSSSDPGVVGNFYKDLCDRRMKVFMQGSPAQPAKDWDEKATTQQYTFCIHSKGL